MAVSSLEEGALAGWPPLASLRFLFRDVFTEIKGRIACYADDWRDGWRCGLRILAPAVYIYCASALPALAFGQQLAEHTDGILTVVHVLVSTAIAGLLQSTVGGQPLLIIGVAEPIVLIYSFMYQFLDGRSGAPEFLAWAAWVCVWTSALLVVLAGLNTGSKVSYITKLSGELFGMLIAVLFLEQAIKGTITEFGSSPLANLHADEPDGSSTDHVINGLWALIIAMGLVLTALLLHSARGWSLFRSWIRGFLADYGAPMMVVVWSAASYIASDSLPGGKPRRVDTPNTWDVGRDSWTVAARMAQVPTEYVFMALLPAAIVTMLFWFDHGVSSLLAQQQRFGIERPPAYNWDLLLLAAMTLICGLLGLPPVNGVLPQAPMHTHTLVTLHSEMRAKEQRRRARKLLPPARSFADFAAAWRCRLNDFTSSVRGLTGSPSKPGLDAQHHRRSADLPRPPADFAVAAAAAAAAGGGSQGARGSPEAPSTMLHLASAPDLLSSGCKADGPANGNNDNACCSGRLQRARLDSLEDCSASRGGSGSESASGARERRSGKGLREASCIELVVDKAGAAAAPGESAAAAAAACTEDAGGGRCRRREGARGAPGGGSAGPGPGPGPPSGPRASAHASVASVAGSRAVVPDASTVQPGVTVTGPPSSCASAIELLKAQENRVSNLIQSVMLAATLGLTPLIRLIPTSVLWGYFAYMAAASLPGNDMWDRIVLLVSDHACWFRYKADKPVLTSSFILVYTVFQLGYLLGIVALVTWAGIAGISFPVPILALVPLRVWLLPKMLSKQQVEQLSVLDPKDV